MNKVDAYVFYHSADFDGYLSCALIAAYLKYNNKICWSVIFLIDLLLQIKTLNHIIKWRKSKAGHPNGYMLIICIKHMMASDLQNKFLDLKYPVKAVIPNVTT